MPPNDPPMIPDPDNVAFKAELAAIARDAADIASGLAGLRGRVESMSEFCNQTLGGSATFVDSKAAVAAGAACNQIDITVAALRAAIALAQDAHGTM